MWRGACESVGHGVEEMNRAYETHALSQCRNALRIGLAFSLDTLNAPNSRTRCSGRSASETPTLR